MKAKIINSYLGIALIMIMAAIIIGCTPASPAIDAPGPSPEQTGEAESCETPEVHGTPDGSQGVEICKVPGLQPDGTEATATIFPAAETTAPTEPPPATATAEPPTPTPTVPQPTSTPEGPAYDPVSFAVIGDYGLAGGPESDVSALVKKQEPDLVLTTGDNNYPAGLGVTIDENVGQYYHEFIHPYKGVYGEGATENRFFPTLGNHDWDSGGAQAYLDYFTLPGNERYYDFVRGPVHFFAVDSDSREPDGVSSNSIQAMWLQEGLAAAEEPWKIVYMHHPAYSSAIHGPITWMQWPFAEWGATAVLGGHDHVYERLEVDGLTYITTGLGGFGPYNFDDPLPESQVRFNQDYGALFVEATEDAITFQFITRAGEVVDTFTITGP